MPVSFMYRRVFITLNERFVLSSEKIRNIMISSSTHSPPKKRSRPDPVVSAESVQSSGTTNGTDKMPVPSREPVLEISKLTEDAIVPTRGSVQSAGLDLYSSKEAWVPALGKTLVSTGLSIALPNGCYGRVAPRSGLSSKHFVDVGAGVIDQDYRGEVKVLLFNFNRVDYHVKKGDRIAQLICEKIYIPEVKVVQELSVTERGEGGFGSTGKN